MSEPLRRYKGFLPGYICRGFQFKLGETNSLPGSEEVIPGVRGFHSHENPLATLGAYPPVLGVYAIVHQTGVVRMVNNPTRVMASSKLTIARPLTAPELAEEFPQYLKKNSPEWDKPTCPPLHRVESCPTQVLSSAQAGAVLQAEQVAGLKSRVAAVAAGASSMADVTNKKGVACSLYSHSMTKAGSNSIAAACGYASASVAYGRYSIAASCGGNSVALASDKYTIAATTAAGSLAQCHAELSAAVTTGPYSRAVADCRNSTAVAVGRGVLCEAAAPNSVAMVTYRGFGAARGVEGSTLVLCRMAGDYDVPRSQCKVLQVGECGIKPDTWYWVNEENEVVEAPVDEWLEEMI